MKCPICGQELRPGKKDPNYLLCYNCKKKFKKPAAKTTEKKKGKARVQETEAQTYSNIPPKQVRKKREAEMRRAYDEMLSVEDDRKRKKKKPAMDDDFYEYEDEKVSKAPIIILGIAIVVVALVIAYMLLK